MLKHDQIRDVKLESVNPATKEKIKEYPSLSSKELQSKLRGSETIWQSWRSQSFAKKEELLERLSFNLLEKKEVLSEVITKEDGKTSQSIGPGNRKVCPPLSLL